MRKIIFLLFFIFLIIFTFSVGADADAELEMSIRDHLIVIEDREGDFPEDEHIEFYQELHDFYNSRNHKPIWFGENKMKIDVDQLLKEIEASYHEGLNPEDYHLSFIKDALEDEDIFNNENRDLRAVTDIILTDAYLKLAAHYLSGKIDPDSIKKDYNLNHDNLDSEKLLSDLISEDNLRQQLREQLPKSDNYQHLKDKLYYYRDSGKIISWPKISEGEILAEKASGARVGQLIKNLVARNYLSENYLEKEDYFDENIKSAVVIFQRNNGLNSDGIVGQSTIKALNTSLDQRIKQIIINMERWRWLPEKLGEKYIYVNIADYNLKVYEYNEIIMEMKTIVGKEQRSTPVFSDNIKYLVLNPYWYVPESIAVEDKLPLIKEDIDYLKDNNYSLFKYIGNNNLEKIEAEDVEWKEIDEDNFNYLLRQNPGDNNALGRFKFMFPNKFDIYLHDTPSKNLFEESDRGFSSGCIRIEKPIDLAEYLLRDKEDWSREEIEEEIKKDKEKTIYLKEPYPIYLQYNTAWVDELGALNFREDIYNRDSSLIQAYFDNKEFK
ncbi:MAG: L,D-transpeptidase family protein [bacterium]